jgi:putative salt-induced outer membrane protein
MKRLILLLALAGAVVTQAQDAQRSVARIATAPTAADKAAPVAKENSIAVGLTLTDGNSDTLLGNVSLLKLRLRDDYSLRLGADFAYGEDQDEKTTDNARALAEYRHGLNERIYAFGTLSAMYDEIADVDYRFVLSVGPGVYLIQNERSTLGVEAGPAYIHEKVGGEPNDELALRVGERYDCVLSATAKCWQAFEYLPVVEDFDDYLMNSEIGVEAAINASLSIRLVVKNTFDSTPAPDREKSDTTVIGALAYQL